MNLNELTKITTNKKTRLGQGHGSGRVKTSGRGTKGQKARGSVALTFEGGALPLIKRMPFRRGKDKNKVFKPKPVILNVKALNLLSENATVDVATLVKNRLVDEKDAKEYGVKVLGDGTLSKKLTVNVAVSKGAATKIEKAGGKVGSAQ